MFERVLRQRWGRRFSAVPDPKDVNVQGRGRDLFQLVRGLLIGISHVLRLLPQPVRQVLFASIRHLDGKVGLGLRYALLCSLASSVEDNVSIHPGVFILNPNGLTVGQNVSIHPMSYIDCAGGINISRDVSIAHGATILSSSHANDAIDVPIKDQGVRFSETRIDQDVWIGAKATVVGGVVVGRGSIVGAGAVVVRDVPPYSVVGGVPARVIRDRVARTENR